MPAYKGKKTGFFYVQFYYRDARGAKRHKTRKGFQTELEALLWEKNVKALKDDALVMEVFNRFGEAPPSGKRATRGKGPNDDLFGMSRR